MVASPAAATGITAGIARLARTLGSASAAVDTAARATRSGARIHLRHTADAAHRQVAAEGARHQIQDAVVLDAAPQAGPAAATCRIGAESAMCDAVDDKDHRQLSAPELMTAPPPNVPVVWPFLSVKPLIETLIPTLTAKTRDVLLPLTANCDKPSPRMVTP